MGSGPPCPITESSPRLYRLDSIVPTFQTGTHSLSHQRRQRQTPAFSERRSRQHKGPTWALEPLSHSELPGPATLAFHKPRHCAPADLSDQNQPRPPSLFPHQRKELLGILLLNSVTPGVPEQISRGWRGSEMCTQGAPRQERMVRKRELIATQPAFALKYIHHSRSSTDRSVGTESRLAAARGWGRGNRSDANGVGVSFWGDEDDGLELERSGCTTL